MERVRQLPHNPELAFDAFYADPPYGITNQPWDDFGTGAAQLMNRYAYATLMCAKPGAVNVVCTTFDLLPKWRREFKKVSYNNERRWKAMSVPLICVDDGPQRTFRPAGQHFTEFKCVTEVVQFFLLQERGVVPKESLKLDFTRSTRYKEKGREFTNLISGKQYVHGFLLM